MKRKDWKKVCWLRYVMICLLSSVILASLFSMGGCAKKDTSPTQEIPPNYTTFTDEQGLFSISYPPDWEPALSLIPEIEQYTKEIIASMNSNISLSQPYLIFIAGIPVETGYSPSVSIMVESMPPLIITHNQMVEAETQGTKQVLQDYHEFSRIQTTVDGIEATIVEWEGTYPQVGKNHCLQMFILVGKDAWVVSCVSTSGEFSKWERDSQAIVRSLRILK